MIRLNKTNIPAVLQANGPAWTSELMTFVNSGHPIPDGVSNRYNHPQVKAQVKIETFNKCCYCESKVTQVYPGDIEHIVPKAKYPRLTFAWRNLTFVCFSCNNKKRDYLNRQNPLLNPYKDDPNIYLRAFGPLIFQINGDTRGESTIKKLELNRPELRERRTDLMNSLQRLIDKFHKEADPQLKEILRDELIDAASDQNEYSLIAKQFIKDNGVI